VIPYHKPYHQLVIALSANSDEETRLEALEAGADAFMAKPFTYENFLEVMEHRLEN
jgi:DNA-binding response OmpR family regulator